MTLPYSREESKDGTVRIASANARFLYVRPRPGVVFIRIHGHDQGEFGTATVDELRGDLFRYPPVELFIEAGAGAGAITPVREMWTDWFAAQKSAIKSCSILVQTKYMHITMEVAKLFSRTGEMIRVYLDRAAFEEALQRAAPGSSIPA